MVNICDSKKCTGCMACYNACPKNAIEIKRDSEGFDIPIINQERCINCKLCAQICPANKQIEAVKPIKIYCGWSKNDNVRVSSSSGGVFFELAKYIIQKGGCVFGCKLDDNLQAVHAIAEDINELEELKGSKYSQSKISSIYKSVRLQLQNDKMVLFSGTPCQVSGLQSFLRKPYPNLITVDFICHGIPSPMLFEDYKAYLRNNKGFSVIDSIYFRKKEKSWVQYNMEVSGKTKSGQQHRYIGHYLDDPWIRGFLSDNFLRPSCYTCQYSTIYRVSDFTIADWWSYNSPSNGDYTYVKKGVSSISCNTEKAVNYINQIKDRFFMEERSVHDYLNTNPSLTHSWACPSSRDSFWKDYNNLGFEQIISKYMGHKNLTLSQHIATTDLSSKSKRLLYFVFHKLERFLNKVGLSTLIIKY